MSGTFVSALILFELHTSVYLLYYYFHRWFSGAPFSYRTFFFIWHILISFNYGKSVAIICKAVSINPVAGFHSGQRVKKGLKAVDLQSHAVGKDIKCGPTPVHLHCNRYTADITTQSPLTSDSRGFQTRGHGPLDLGLKTGHLTWWVKFAKTPCAIYRQFYDWQCWDKT